MVLRMFSVHGGVHFGIFALGAKGPCPSFAGENCKVLDFPPLSVLVTMITKTDKLNLSKNLGRSRAKVDPNTI